MTFVVIGALRVNAAKVYLKGLHYLLVFFSLLRKEDPNTTYSGQ